MKGKAKIVKTIKGLSQPLKDTKGLTLIEIMVVITILGSIAALVGVNVLNSLHEANVKTAQIQISNFEAALDEFRRDNGIYPTTEQGLQALVQKPTSGRESKNWREGGYLKKKELPLDSWKNPYVYYSPGTHGDNEYEIICYGRDGKEGGTGKEADVNSWEVNK